MLSHSRNDKLGARNDIPSVRNTDCVSILRVDIFQPCHVQYDAIPKLELLRLRHVRADLALVSQPWTEESGVPTHENRQRSLTPRLSGVTETVRKQDLYLANPTYPHYEHDMTLLGYTGVTWFGAECHNAAHGVDCNMLSNVSPGAMTFHCR